MIAIGCDEAAYNLKELIKSYLLSKGLEVKDFGVKSETESILYPNVAFEVATSIKNNEAQRGILLCGTGIGVCISANKVSGIRAAVAHDTYSAERARKSNDAQILCLGARVVGPELAKTLVDAWLASEFQGGASQDKVKRIEEYEEEQK